MSLRLVLCLCAAAILLGATSVSAANAPELLNYQGVLKSGGTPVTTPVNVTFTIYDAESSGNAVWTQDLPVTPDANGVFSVRLGEGVGLGDSVFTGPDRWLGVQDATALAPWRNLKQVLGWLEEDLETFPPGNWVELPLG